MRRTYPHNNERGVTLVVMAISIFLFLGMAALTIDYGMVKSQKAEAQRAMDAAALAGAAVYQVSDPAFPKYTASKDTAWKYALLHRVGGKPILMAEVTPVPDVANNKITVTFARSGIRTWFANALGANSFGFTATAAAHVEETNTAQCVKPVALPDAWDNRTVGSGKTAEDPNNDHIWNYADKNSNGIWDEAETEQWSFNGSDVYDSTTNGLGTTFRDNYGTGSNRKAKDYGRQILIASFSPKDGTVPSFYLTWGDKPSDNNVPDIQDRILNGCYPVDLSRQYAASNGAKLPTGQAWDDLIAKDAGASWDDVNNKIIPSAKYPDPATSPRTILVGLYHPGLYNNCSSCNNFTFNNLAKVFLETRPCTGNGQCKQPLTGRFLGFAEGGGKSGTPTGTLPKHLVLIK